MTDSTTQNESTASGGKGKVIFILLALILMAGTALYLAHSNSQKREIFKQKITETIKTDSAFIQDNNCWTTGKNGLTDLGQNEIKFIPSNSSEKKNFHYKCTDGRGYASNVYVGKHDLSNLNFQEKQAIEDQLKQAKSVTGQTTQTQ